MAKLPTPEVQLTLDLELPTEALEYMIEEEVEDGDVLPSLFRLIFWMGYAKGRSDNGALSMEIKQCGSTP